jgi:hypothetical protein
MRCNFSLQASGNIRPTRQFYHTKSILATFSGEKCYYAFAFDIDGSGFWLYNIYI